MVVRADRASRADLVQPPRQITPHQLHLTKLWRQLSVRVTQRVGQRTPSGIVSRYAQPGIVPGSVSRYSPSGIVSRYTPPGIVPGSVSRYTPSGIVPVRTPSGSGHVPERIPSGIVR